MSFGPDLDFIETRSLVKSIKHSPGCRLVLLFNLHTLNNSNHNFNSQDYGKWEKGSFFHHINWGKEKSAHIHTQTFIDLTNIGLGCRSREEFGPSCKFTEPYTPRINVIDTATIKRIKVLNHWKLYTQYYRGKDTRISNHILQSSRKIKF